MLAKQLTVFIENRQGRLSVVLDVLKEAGVNILSLSLSDTTEFGLLRLIVSDAEKGKNLLTEKGFSSLLSNVSIIKIPHEVGSLQNILATIDKNGGNIEYMYGLSIEANEAYVVLKASDEERIEKILADAKITTVGCKELAESKL